MTKYISLLFLKSVVCNALKAILCSTIRCHVGRENRSAVNSRRVRVSPRADELSGLCHQHVDFAPATLSLVLFLSLFLQEKNCS